jgi:hypothetical protein
MMLRSAFVLATLFAFAGAAQAGPMTSITLDDCDYQGCEGTTLMLSVEDNMDGTWTVVQQINSAGFSEVRLGMNQVGFKAIKNWSDAELMSAPTTGWEEAKEANVSSNGLCKNGTNTDKVCTSGFVNIIDDDVYTWEYVVTGGTLMDENEWHWGGQFADDATKTTGKIISASPIPEPNAAIVFGVGALLVGRALRRPRR